MTSRLGGLEPQALWQHFAKICEIPHPSRHEAKLAEYITAFGREQGLSVERDQVGNVLIRRPASPGHEDLPSVVLQTHLDMVPQKNSDSPHDFCRDPIQAYVDGGWVKARGTTLGADNGIGVAAALAVLARSDLKTGPLEALFTVDEESGMTGAQGLKSDFLRSRLLLNLDSEDEGEFCVGCAGGIDTNISLPFTKRAVDAAGKIALAVSLTGLKGGHSGCDIQLGRGNAIKLMARLCDDLAAVLPYELSSFAGGTLRNAIPREAFAVLLIKKQDEAALAAWLEKFAACLRAEFTAEASKLQLEYKRIELPAEIIDGDAVRRLLFSLRAAANGVLRMHSKLVGVVETSTNIGSVVQLASAWQITTMQRSAIDSSKHEAAASVGAAFHLAAAEVEHSGAYPGWQPKLDGQLLKQLQTNYRELFHNEAKIVVTHGGLECGLISGVYPDMEMVSFGPSIRAAHSPDEMVDIASVERFYRLLCYTLEHIPRKQA